MKKIFHLHRDLRCGTLIIYLLASREKNILDRLLYRALVYRGISYLSDKGGVLKKLFVNTEENLTCRNLSKRRRAGFKVGYRGILLIGNSLSVINSLG